MSQVLAPPDVLKLGMVAAFYVTQGLGSDPNCQLSEWLLTLWKVLVFELICKFMIQACVARNSLTSFLVSLILIGETGWNIYGIYLFIKRPEPMRCSEETYQAFQIALGLYVVSNFAAMLLGCCRAAEPPKPKIAQPESLRPRTPDGTKLHSK